MPTLFLDRDGVINQDSRDFVRSPEDWIPIAGSLEAIAAAQQHGYRIIVVSNQSGLGRELLGIRDLNRIHNRLQNELGKHGGRVDAFFFCPHTPDAQCTCRKPLPGLLLDAQARLGLDLSRSTLIGDRLTDVEAAHAVGMAAILVETGLDTIDDAPDVPVCSDLSAAVQSLIQ